MQSRLISVTVFLSIFFALSAVLLFSFSIPGSSVGAPASLSVAQDEVAAEPAKTLTQASSTAPTATGQAVADGPSLLARHCAQCHLARSLTEIKKDRSEWEQALARMERLGVRLSAGEKVVLLDYLSEP